MSSTNDTYHHLLVQTQPKSILKKSPSPRFLDTSINSEKSYYSNPIPSSIYDTEKIDIDKCITNDNQSVTKDNSNISSVKIPLTKLIITSNENLCQYEIDSQMIQNNPPPVDSSSSFTSDDEKQQQKQQRIRIKSKKNYYRPLVAIGTLPSSASSSENDERKAKRSMEESKITLIRSHKHREKDMQLDEFMRKYQQQGGISFPSKQDHDNDQITTKSPINHHHHQSKQQVSYVKKESIMNDDTVSLLDSIDTITLAAKIFSPLQLLFDVARKTQYDRRSKIERIRQYVEEQIGISAFLTIYKLIKSSQIPINIQDKPFCYYANFIPHLCCLIILESEEQKKSFI